jgi:hypothetical protein
LIYSLNAVALPGIFCLPQNYQILLKKAWLLPGVILNSHKIDPGRKQPDYSIT